MRAMPAVAVAVPARNEAEHLPHLLQALADQVNAPPFTLCLFLDACTDGGADLVAAMAGGLPYQVVVESDGNGAPNAGLARRRAAALAEKAAPGAVLMTTDADGQPAEDWIAANLAGLTRADIVAGRVTRGSGPSSPMQDRIEDYYERLHLLRRTIDPVAWEDASTHHWVSGASLAMHASTYHALGGFTPVAHGEDAALGDAAARAGYRLRRDAHVVVRTSARRYGRAMEGLAAALARLDDPDHRLVVAHPDDEAWRFAMQADARLLHGAGGHDVLAWQLGLPLAEVAQVAAECRNGEAFAARIVGAPPSGMRTVSLSHAELLLAVLEQSHLQGAA